MYVTGTDGYDSISGYNEDDTYYLKKGNDIVKDYFGNDTYYFEKGDGADRYTDSAGTDRIDFYSGIESGDLFFTRQNNNVIVSVKNSTDSITIVDWFTSPKYKIESIFTDDGATITSADVEQAILNGGNLGKIISGTSGNDSITGTVGSDTINAFTGNDIVFTKQGNDIITGGPGNDFINGGDGDDVYIFNKGDGQDVIYDPDNNDNPNNDVIKFGTGIASSDLTFIKDDYNLVVRLNNSNDQITINDYYYPPEFFETKIEKFAFVDGTFLTEQDVENRIIDVIEGTDDNDSLIGTDGNDSIYGLEGNDTLVGSSGNDYLNGSYGNDTYIFNKCDGQDIIEDSGGTDTLRFGSGITEDDLEFVAKPGLNLEIDIKNTNDKITVNLWDFYPDTFTIENIVFDNGESLSLQEIKSKVQGMCIIGTNGDDILLGAWNNDTIYGLGGNDYLDGGADGSYGYPYEEGSDYLDGGTGNDTIDAYGGKDTLIGGLGNDLLGGAGGDDLYIFNKGDGKDTIWDGNPDTGDGAGSLQDTLKFGSNITKDDLEFKIQDFDLIVSLKNTIDSITIQNWTLSEEEGYSNFKIERFVFCDGGILTDTDVENIINNQLPVTPTVVGTDGNDTRTGYNGNDIYYLKKGNDTVKDYSGNDTYLFNKGDGQDRITDSNGADTIKFGTAITQLDLNLSRVYTNSLQLGIKGTTDSITVIDWFTQSKYQIEKVEFSDGSYLTNSQINQMTQQISTFGADNETQVVSSTSLYNQQLLNNLVITH